MDARLAVGLTSTRKRPEKPSIIAQSFLKNTANRKKITTTSAVELLAQEIIFLAGCLVFSVRVKLLYTKGRFIFAKGLPCSEAKLIELQIRAR